MTKEEQNIADVEFICEEIIRLLNLSPEAMKQYFEEDPLNMFRSLNTPSRRMLFCGKAAFDRFYDLAGRTIKSRSAEEKQFDRESYVNALHTAFVEVFAEKGMAASKGSVSKFINRAKQLASEKLIHVTHHIPCVLFSNKDPEIFAVGPITFRRTGKFFVDEAQAFEKYHCEEVDLYSKGLCGEKSALSEDEIHLKAKAKADEWIKVIQDYYRDYGWVASVTIPPCHAELSRSSAERATDAALDVLRLFVGSYSKEYRRANASNGPYRIHRLASDRTGCLLVSHSYGGGGVPAGEDWYDSIMKLAVPYWNLFEEAITALIFDKKNDELNQRLLDALHWFGQAVTEPNPAAKVVKYAAALERITMTGHPPKGLAIENRVIERVLLLNIDRPDTTSDELRKELAEIYECRSALMHGSLSPYHHSISKVLGSARKISRWTLLNAAQLFATLREAGKNGRKDLDAAYNNILSRPCVAPLLAPSGKK